MDLVHLVWIDRPRGDATSFTVRRERMQEDGFWQDVGETDGKEYASAEAADQAAAEWVAWFAANVGQ